MELIATKHFNQMTPAEAERLAILAEECGEVIQVVGKILRHGYNSTHPNGGVSNRTLLEKELGDVLCVVDRMTSATNGGWGPDLRKENIPMFRNEKDGRLRKYTHHQPGDTYGL